VIKPGTGWYDEKRNIVVQYNTDGTKSGYTKEQWAQKKMKEREIQLLQNDRKWAIPKSGRTTDITLDKGVEDKYGVRNRNVPVNVLDSIAVNAERAGLPFREALGISIKESSLGKGKDKYGNGRGYGQSYLPWLSNIRDPKTTEGKWARGVSYDDVQSPTLLVPDWQRYESPFAPMFYDGRLQPLSPQEHKRRIDDEREYLLPAMHEYNNSSFVDQSPLQHAFAKFKNDPDSYNHGDPTYPQKVRDIGNFVVANSPEIRQYMEERGIKADGGRMSRWSDLPIREKREYIRAAVRQGMRDMPSIRKAYNEFAKGGNLYDGWTMPSQQMRDDISRWEGALMATNRSFGDEARDFIRALPAGVRERVLSNPRLADYLYSYSYNVGAGRFRERVVPALESYYEGDGTVEDIQKSMWASKDTKLRGLARRRQWERDGVKDALRDTETERLNRRIDTPSLPAAMPEETAPQPVQIRMPEYLRGWQPQQQDEETTYRQDPNWGIRTLYNLSRMMGQEQEGDGTLMAAPPTGEGSPYVVRTQTNGGNMLKDGGKKKDNGYASSG